MRLVIAVLLSGCLLSTAAAAAAVAVRSGEGRRSGAAALRLLSGGDVERTSNPTASDGTPSESGWVLHTVNIAAYAGETLDLQIRVENDDVLVSNLYVDDVYFESRDPQGGVLLSPLPNGNFESGAVIWNEVSWIGWNLILYQDELPQWILPHSGNWATWLGDIGEEFAYIEQRVTVPVGSPVLKYWHWIESEDVCGYDFAGVIVNGWTVIDEYDLCFHKNTAGQIFVDGFESGDTTDWSSSQN